MKDFIWPHIDAVVSTYKREFDNYTNQPHFQDQNLQVIKRFLYNLWAVLIPMYLYIPFRPLNFYVPNLWMNKLKVS